MATLVTKYKPYPAYRESGVKWLGNVPAHWEVRRLKYSAPIRAHKLDRKAADAIYVGLEHIESWTGRLLLNNQPDTVDSVVTSFRTGDVFFGKLRPYLAKSARPDFDGVATSEVLVLRPHGDCLQSYVMYSLLNEPFVRWINVFTYGAKMPRVSPDQVAISFTPIPPLPEQRAIAGFLDRETAKIDSLVAKKERLIELLQEKRTALISRAVTKGLDADVPMKDSGVEWLGEIPANWEVKRLKHSAKKIGSGKTPKGGAEGYVNDGIMLLRSQNVQFGGLHLEEVAYIDDATDCEMSGSRVEEGDVLFNITGASLGRCSVARLEGSAANVNQHVCIVRPDRRRDDPSFLAYSIESRSLQDQIFINENGVSRDALNFEQLGALVYARPSKMEQDVLVSYLSRQTAKIEALVAKVHEAIEHLKEFRTAVISAAVTGKIDVRESAA